MEELTRNCKIQCDVWRDSGGAALWDNNFKYFVIGAFMGAVGMLVTNSLVGAIKFAIRIFKEGREALSTATAVPPAPSTAPPLPFHRSRLS
ncbi:hypothetical protein Y032_0739g1963 [Ancylostoma ceylanicum]|uniref:Uncharacterized protein n=1 Tax=Ancylostoma ceylanicum TaxID=53326 RepID=A0A016WEX9_9BILA|nr:hypothetical protein Y032_0739g1963 [Ancylostoma ceylanicum]